MSKGKLISYKIQTYLAFIPYLGVFCVVLTSFYNIIKLKNRLFAGLYYLLILIPIVFFLFITGLIEIYFIATLENYIVRLILSFGALFLALLCIAIACIGIERGLIERLMRKEESKDDFK